MWTHEYLNFVHSLKTFCQLKEVKEVVVVCEPDYSDVFEGSYIFHTFCFYRLCIRGSSFYDYIQAMIHWLL